METRKNPIAANEGALEHQSNRNNSTIFSAQTIRVRDALLAAGRFGLTSLELQETYGVAHPPARIYDLREGGYNILTRMAAGEDVFGRTRRVGRYYLISMPGSGGAS